MLTQVLQPAESPQTKVGVPLWWKALIVCSDLATGAANLRPMVVEKREVMAQQGAETNIVLAGDESRPDENNRIAIGRD